MSHPYRELRIVFDVVLGICPELLIHSYYNIVKREIIDMVPKAISLTLVNFAKESIQKELLQELYKPEVLDDLLKESEYVVNRRKEVVQMLSALNKAEEYVQSILSRIVFQLTMAMYTIGLCLQFECFMIDIPISTYNIPLRQCHPYLAWQILITRARCPCMLQSKCSSKRYA